MVGEELGSNIGNPRPSGFKSMTQIYIYFSTDEKKPDSFDTVFLIVVGEELDSNIENPRPSGFKPMTQIYIYFSTDEKKPDS
ncbi:hypothetical protein, partial [Photobacterium iliopiscarium]|uniref:hypothetical protein n=1 Tax=Photobacterium iliopiscarium TaxID=56192 RepID=UPI00242D5E93